MTNIRSTTVEAEVERMKFAQEAAEYFAKHPEKSSYGELVPGAFLALRWGLGDDCVMTLKLDDYDVPVNYTQIVRKPPTGN